MGTRWLRRLGLGIGCLASAFWIWFGVASAAGERLGSFNWILHLLLPGGVLAASLLIALRWEGLGGALLALEGLAVAVAYPWMTWSRFPLTTIAFVLLTLALPPLLAGILFLADAPRWRRLRG